MAAPNNSSSKRRKVRYWDCDTDTHIDVIEIGDDEPLATVMARTFGGAAPASTVAPRLLSDVDAATFLGISRSACRALIANGVIKRVQLPSVDGQAGRASRVLRVDLHDLEKLIERWKG